jgi:hypothetical protein
MDGTGRYYRRGDGERRDYFFVVVVQLPLPAGNGDRLQRKQYICHIQIPRRTHVGC